MDEELLLVLGAPPSAVDLGADLHAPRLRLRPGRPAPAEVEHVVGLDGAELLQPEVAHLEGPADATAQPRVDVGERRPPRGRASAPALHGWVEADPTGAVPRRDLVVLEHAGGGDQVRGRSQLVRDQRGLLDLGRPPRGRLIEAEVGPGPSNPRWVSVHTGGTAPRRPVATEKRRTQPVSYICSSWRRIVHAVTPGMKRRPFWLLSR